MSSQVKPLVTFVVPCYNSASFMRRAVDSLLKATRPVEILLINDGSSDETSAVAHAYEARHDNVRAIDQENANWGGAVNHGIRLARGSYLKVVDSDDYLEPHALNRVLEALAHLMRAQEAPDLLFTNYVYDHLPSKTWRVMDYRPLFPQGHVFGWDEVHQHGIDRFIMIHAAWFSTDVLRTSGVSLPTGASYMDSLLLLHPLPYVQKLYYLDVQPYFYAIGREGQTIDVEVIKRHIDEQLMATRLAIEDVDYTELFETNPGCAKVMCGYMQCMLSVSTLNLFIIGTPDAIAKNDELWAYLKERNPALYRRMRVSWAGLANRRTAAGRVLAARCYKVIRKIYKLA